MSVRETLRKKNRTVLEMNLGILATGILLQAVALLLAPQPLRWCLSFLLGTVLSLLAVEHMYRTLDRALDADEETASKMIYKGYLFRYLILVAVILLLIGTKWLDPLLMFLAYLGLKITAYLQPLTHKICNKIFHETDPEPQPEPEAGAQGERATEES